MAIIKSFTETILAGRPLMKKMLAALTIVLAFYFLTENLAASYEKLSRFSFDVRYLPLLLSLVLLLLTFLFHPWAWKGIMAEMGEKMSYRQAFAIIYLSQIGKYLPGRLWSYVSQVYLAKKEGFSGEKTLIASIIFQVMTCFMSLYVFTLSFLFWREVALELRAAVFLLSSLAAFIVLRGNLAESALLYAVNRVAKRRLSLQLRRSAVFRAIFILLLNWLAYGAAYYLFLRSIFPLELSLAVVFTGIYAISWLIGYVSLLTPGGLGVREGVQAYLLSFFLPLPMAIIISLACRVWLTLAEAAAALPAFWLMRGRKADGVATACGAAAEGELPSAPAKEWGKEE